MGIAIEATNLSKIYRIGKRRSTSFREALSEKWSALLSGRPQPTKEFWALRDVSFQVQQGETLAIIGKNGAGKTTLLKILSRITDPSAGKAVIYGRTSSLLEVGTGFHPELTGRENIFLNGAILGMSRSEVKKRFHDIVAFSGIEEFIDTPVKRYSSGMFVRLAFAVAAHLEPDILIVDEVLAVGDAEFQKKCLGKMQAASRQQGRTVLFVSHNMEAVQNLCQRALLLQDGRIVEEGETTAVVHHYLHRFLAHKVTQQWTAETAPGNADIRLLAASVRSERPGASALYTNDTLIVEVRFQLLRKQPTHTDVTFHLRDENGVLVLVASTAYTLQKYFADCTLVARATIPGNILNQGSYSISRLLFVEKRGIIMFETNDVLSFEILPEPTSRLGWVAGKKEGIIFLPTLPWTLDIDS